MSRFDASDTVRMRSDIPHGAPHRRARIRVRQPSPAGTAGTSGGCSRGSSPPCGSAWPAAARSAARAAGARARATRLSGMRNCSPIEYGLRALGDRRGSSAPSSLADFHVVRTAQHDVLGVVIEARQAEQHVADVRADAEVVQLPRVDRDAHYADSDGFRRFKVIRRLRRLRRFTKITKITKITKNTENTEQRPDHQDARITKTHDHEVGPDHRPKSPISRSRRSQARYHRITNSSMRACRSARRYSFSSGAQAGWCLA